MSEALTTSCSPSPSAKRAMMSSGALPNVTFSRPPMPGPERAASSSVARPISAAVGMTPSAEVKKTGDGVGAREVQRDRDRDERDEQVGPALGREEPSRRGHVAPGYPPGPPPTPGPSGGTTGGAGATGRRSPEHRCAPRQVARGVGQAALVGVRRAAGAVGRLAALQRGGELADGRVEVADRAVVRRRPDRLRATHVAQLEREPQPPVAAGRARVADVDVDAAQHVVALAGQELGPGVVATAGAGAAAPPAGAGAARAARAARARRPAAGRGHAGLEAVDAVAVERRAPA